MHNGVRCIRVLNIIVWRGMVKVNARPRNRNAVIFANPVLGFFLLGWGCLVSSHPLGPYRWCTKCDHVRDSFVQVARIMKKEVPFPDPHAPDAKSWQMQKSRFILNPLFKCIFLVQFDSIDIVRKKQRSFLNAKY